MDTVILHVRKPTASTVAEGPLMLRTYMQLLLGREDIKTDIRNYSWTALVRLLLEWDNADRALMFCGKDGHAAVVLELWRWPRVQ
jgi:hypothetical protein